MGPSKLSPFDLPGFTLPLNFTPNAEYTTYAQGDSKGEAIIHPPQGSGKNLFPSALDVADMEQGHTVLPLTPLREFAMLGLMNKITDKPQWEIKVFDDGISSRWKAEAMAADGTDITQSMADWAIEELRYKAGLFKETGLIPTYNGGIVKSDSAIPVSLKKALKTSAMKLEDVPKPYRDYHPGTDETVVNLVHPSLFPLVYGTSRILRDRVATLDNCTEMTGIGEKLSVPFAMDNLDMKGFVPNSNHLRFQCPAPLQFPYSRAFQWLPCDVEFSSPGMGQVGIGLQDSDCESGLGSPRCNIKSYINNLHPQRYRDLYPVIEQIIDCTIPMWDATLTQLKARHYRYPRIPYSKVEYAKIENPEPEPEMDFDEDEDDYEERYEEWEKSLRRVLLPEPGVFKPPCVPENLAEKYLDAETGKLKPEMTVDLRRDYEGLQVIVKLANIELTPEKPRYDGGTWHVEGQMNEHICATALYYYDSENITESRLRFRQQVSAADFGVNYFAGEHEWLEKVFGCHQDGPGVQDVGYITCKEDRLITFPNIFQHQVQNFELADKSRPGHRKILALFLVDPNLRIISTANVPPQRRDWWSEKVFQETPVLRDLPLEMQEHIIDNVEDFPISLEKAKDIRATLMKERTRLSRENENSFKGYDFNLCEH
ncbi:hypothetical protein FQN54_005817 [Arachnomyces sp. PD_36]|nr:hypothetical protein FQN54_005817 [Arachnomyces sp. PD_36]